MRDVAQMMEDFRSAFPDLAYEVEDLVGEGDNVAARWTARGTHRGPVNEIPPSGRPVIVGGTDVFMITNDRIVETWVSSDLLGLMRQIGALG